MPYIKQEGRDFIDRGGSPVNAGELNYAFTRLISQYLEVKGRSYQTFNDVLGALEGSKMELYRRRVAPYEDIKITENGDVA